VRSYGRGVSYTVQFAPSQEFESEDCEDKEVPKGKRKKKDKATEKKDETKQLSLADVPLVWTYSEGKTVKNVEDLFLQHEPGIFA